MRSGNPGEATSAAEVTPRCVAFDLDGVIIPSGPSHDYFEMKYGITRAHFGAFFRGPYRQALVGEVDLFDVLPETLDAWGWRDTTEAFAEIWMKSCAECDPALCEIILDLRRSGIECCLATNQDNRRGAFLDALPDLREIFPQRALRFYSHSMKVRKPDPAYFAGVAETLGRQPAEMLFLDDRPDNVAAARRCGWRAEVCTGRDSVLGALGIHLPEWSLGRSLEPSLD
jgi:HAD superfamily hydrolase (TIGR01509 family)